MDTLAYFRQIQYEENLPIIRGLVRQATFITVLPILSVLCTVAWPRTTYKNAKEAIQDIGRSLSGAKNNFLSEFSAHRDLERSRTFAAVHGLDIALRRTFQSAADDYESLVLNLRQVYGPTRDRTATFST